MRSREHVQPKMVCRELPPYSDPMYRPHPKPTEIPLQGTPRKLTDLDTDINIDFKESSPHQEGIISESYQRPDRSSFQDPPNVKSIVNTGRVVQKFLPNQTDIDKILMITQRKVLKGAHLPVTVKEIQAEYMSSPYFKDLYQYLAQNKLPSTRNAICKVETLAEKFILLYSLLFKLAYYTREGISAIGSTRNMCRQNNYTLPF